jgi:hypothetical protein
MPALAQRNKSGLVQPSIMVLILQGEAWESLKQPHQFENFQHHLTDCMNKKLPDRSNKNAPLRTRSSPGGKGGIRTLGGPEPTTVFETVPFNHSGTFPVI